MAQDKTAMVRDWALGAGLKINQEVRQTTFGHLDHLKIYRDDAPPSSALAMIQEGESIYVTIAYFDKDKSEWRDRSASRLSRSYRDRFAAKSRRLRTWRDVRLAIETMAIGLEVASR